MSHPHYVPAGFNPSPVGYEHHVPMQRGYYPPPPQYGQGGWGFGNPPQIFQHPEVVQYIQELNEPESDCDCSECGGDEEEVETFALESDYSDEDGEERADDDEDSEDDDEGSEGEDRADEEESDDGEDYEDSDDGEDRADEEESDEDRADEEDSDDGEDYEDRADEEESDDDGDDYDDEDDSDY